MDRSNLNAENVSLQLMLKLPTGETVAVPYSMPSVVIIPELTSTDTLSVMSQSPATVLSTVPVDLMSGLVSGHSVPLHFQAPPGSPAVVARKSVTDNNSQPEAAFDLSESGLTALGIAASTREVHRNIIMLV